MDNYLSKDLTNYIIGKHFKLIKKIGSGAFGEIYQVQNTDSNEFYAMKLERSDSKHPQLFFEAKLYNYLNTDSIDRGIPLNYGQGTDGEYNYLVLDQLGMSLEDIFQKQQRKLSIKSVLMLADQMIQRIEYIHSKMFLHRDIKPDNFLMGLGRKQHRVYIIDFGLAKRYLSKEGHIPYREGKSLTGTARYASVNTHMGIEQSRRDDLESIGYVLMYLLRGSLPWQNLRSTNEKDKYQRIMEKKLQTSAEVLCKGYPQELTQYLNYCKTLKFEDKPDYNYLRGLIRESMKKNNFEMDYHFDWTEQSFVVEPDQQQINQQHPPQIQQQQFFPKMREDIIKKNSQHSKLNIKSNPMSLEKLHQRTSSNIQANLNIQSQSRLAPKIVTTKEPHRKY